MLGLCLLFFIFFCPMFLPTQFNLHLPALPRVSRSRCGRPQAPQRRQRWPLRCGRSTPGPLGRSEAPRRRWRPSPCGCPPQGLADGPEDHRATVISDHAKLYLPESMSGSLISFSNSFSNRWSLCHVRKGFRRTSLDDRTSRQNNPFPI